VTTVLAASAGELLAELRRRQVRLEVEAGRLRFSAPPGALTPELRNDLVRRREEIVQLLAREGEPGEESFAHLLAPLRLGPWELRNRIAMSPMEVDLGARDGTVTARTVDYYAERARGGAGLIVVEATCVDAPAGLVSPHQLRADADFFIPGLRQLALAVRAEGARAVLQLQHAGRKASALLTGCQPVAPSAVASHDGETPRALTPEEIAALTARYAQAAARARLAGFDGVEIHAAHGYLVAQFLSPLYNCRDDAWGGPLAHRARFLLELVAAVRRRAGRDFPVLCRLSAADLSAEGEIRPHPGGLTLDETIEVARRLEEAGVAAIDVSATLVGLPRMHPMSWPEGHLVPAAEAIRRAVAVPVSVTSRVSPELAEQHLRAGRLDLVRLGRALIADPWLPRKLALGRRREVTPCIFCSLCVDPKLRQPAAVCAVNPDLGRERAANPDLGRASAINSDLSRASAAGSQPAARRKRVVIVGGGPAGMEAARTAAGRGHQVLLYEEGERLGGQLLVASKPEAARRTLDELCRHLAGEVARLGVEVRLGERFAPELLAGCEPDVVVLATGSRAEPPDWPGGGGAHLLAATEVFAGAPTGERVVVVGSELVGCEAALFLAERGRRVTLLGRSREPASRVPTDLAIYLRWALAERGVEVESRAEVVEAGPGEVVFRDAAGERHTRAADTVVFATGARPRESLAGTLAGKVAALYTIGDCNRPRGIREAIAEGREVALAL
jgi:2,4-dienoyl-CoA reductase-like NADH-dependent reductase (Old Yellow Enzyme family)/thioredoxin reductase